MNSSLCFLVFDLLDADEHTHTWEAMASVAPPLVPAVLREAAGLVAWAQAQFGTGPRALDDGGQWDAWLQYQADQAPPQTLNWPPHMDPNAPLPIPPGTQWVAVTLTLVAAAPLADAVQQHLDAVGAV
ncbi:MAG: hypothetical protein K2W33_04920 [Burkholderiales bacterium]|nr:hypothetical protein [Burkholderiales bacterium]